MIIFGQAYDGMNWMQFVASLVSSLAWPLAAVIIASLFRQQISSLLSKLRKLTWGDKAADFSEALDEVEADVRQSEPVATIDLPAALPGERFRQLVDISPGAAVLDAWMPIEKRLSELAPRPVLGGAMPSRKAITYLAANSTISPEQATTLKALLAIRNSAAHAKDVSITDAWRFQNLATTALQLLERM